MDVLDPGPVDSWQRILEEVRLQKTADLIRDENTPLEFGAFICWKSCGHMGTTSGFGDVHRVGYPQHGSAYTACVELIPAPLMWLPLSPALIRTLRNCTYCNAEVGRIARRQAA